MPLLNTRGAATAYGYGLNQGASTLRVGSSITNNTNASGSATTLSWPAGSQAGDLALVFVAYQGASNNNTITGGSGGVWTKNALAWATLGYYSAVFSKALTSGDLSGNSLNRPDWATDIPSPFIIVVYRGPTTVTVKSTVDNGTGTSITLTGFSRGYSTKAIASFVTDRDASATPVANSPFTAIRGPGGNTSFTANLSDVVIPSLYYGSNVVWTGFGNTFEQVGYLLELT